MGRRKNQVVEEGGWVEAGSSNSKKKKGKGKSVAFDLPEKETVVSLAENVSSESSSSRKRKRKRAGEGSQTQKEDPAVPRKAKSSKITEKSTNLPVQTSSKKLVSKVPTPLREEVKNRLQEEKDRDQASQVVPDLPWVKRKIFNSRASYFDIHATKQGFPHNPLRGFFHLAGIMFVFYSVASNIQTIRTTGAGNQFFSFFTCPSLHVFVVDIKRRSSTGLG